MKGFTKLILDIVMGAVIPILILNNLTKPLGAPTAYVIAALVPVGYVLIDTLFISRRFNAITTYIALTAIMQGALAFWFVDGWQYALKDTAGLIVAVLVFIVSILIAKPMMRFFAAQLFNPDTPEKHRSLDLLFKQPAVHRGLVISTAFIAGVNAIMALVNFALNVNTVTAPFGAELFNQQVAQVNAITRIAFTLGSFVGFGFAFWLMYRAVLLGVAEGRRQEPVRERVLGTGRKMESDAADCNCDNIGGDCQRRDWFVRNMDILILGGTVFLGRHLVDTALACGHRVTLFNRGQHNPDLFPQAEKLRGDREQDLSALEGRRWDVAIDTCGYAPSVVRRSVELLAPAISSYVFISTLSAYKDARVAGIDESYPLATMPAEEADKITSSAQVTGENYGPLKALCEQEVTSAMSDRALIVRPGLIVGPHDPTDRFTYWVRRVAQGGGMLVPDTPNQAWQVIDVRDLVDWTIHVIEARQTGVYNATGPDDTLTFGRILDMCKQVSNSDVNFVWVSEQFAIDEKISTWEALPLWLPSNEPDYAGFNAFDCNKAIKAGLTFRPIAETIRDTLAWDAARPQADLKMGLSRDHEMELLDTWKAKLN